MPSNRIGSCRNHRYLRLERLHGRDWAGLSLRRGQPIVNVKLSRCHENNGSETLLVLYRTVASLPGNPPQLVSSWAGEACILIQTSVNEVTHPYNPFSCRMSFHRQLQISGHI